MPPLATSLDLEHDRFLPELPPGVALPWTTQTVQVLGVSVPAYADADNGHGYLSDVVRLRVVS